MRMYRWLLRLCPRALRAEYGAAMEETFARRLADAKGSSFRRRARIRRRELTSVLALAVAERWRSMLAPRHPQKDVMQILTQEIRHAARRLLRSPAFSLAATLTLALAIGANVAIFSVVYGVVLNPLPFHDPDRLIAIDYGWPTRNIASGVSTITEQMYFQYLDRASTLDGALLYEQFDATITGNGEPERLRAVRSTPSASRLLGVPPVLGRWFSEEEGAPGAPPTGVLSYGFWQRRFGGDQAIVGKTITLNGISTSVIGVMPRSFVFPEPQYELWVPLPLARATARDAFGYSSIVRLRAGVTLADARAEFTRITNDLEADHPGNGYKELRSTATTLLDATVGRVARTLWVLLASVGLVLLVACANVANLFLVRSEVRQRDIAVRRALGAGSGGIARYFLTESALLSIVGGIIGLALAEGALRLLVALGPANLPRLGDIRLDEVAVVFGLALSLVAAVAFGGLPLFRMTSLTRSLHDSGRGNTASRGRHRVRQLLMAGQVALALVLLVASGLLVRSFQKLRSVDPGFDATSAVTFQVGLPSAGYPQRAQRVATHYAILDRLSALPGVTAVSAASQLPLSFFGFGGGLFIEGREVTEKAPPPIVAVRAVAGGFFETMGTRLLRGRTIERGDVERNEAVAVINDALVRSAFPNEDPIGKRVRLPSSPSLGPRAYFWWTIVGVVATTPVRALGENNPVPVVYFPMSSAREFGPPLLSMNFVVRTAAAPSSLMPSIRRAIADVDPTLPLAQVQTLQTILDRAAAQMAFTMILIGIAAGVALLLGVIGIYGAMSYIVSQRTGEIGVRLALGAEPGSVARMIIWQGGVVAGAGIVAGLATAFAGSRLIESLLYGVSPRDPAVFAATTAILLAVALIACWLPARRAARLSPLEALRTD